MKRPLFPRWPLLLVILPLLACGQLGPAPEGEASWTPVETLSAPQATQAAVPTAIPAATPDEGSSAGAVTLRPAPAGFACFASGEGLSCLDESGSWQRFATADVPLADRLVHALARCPDNTLLAAASDQLFRFDGNQWQPAAGEWGGTTPDDVGCAPDGTLWVAYFRGLSRYADGWLSYDADLLGSPDEDGTDLVEAVDVTPAGQVWVATARSVATLEGEAWRTFTADAGFPQTLFISDLAAAPDGNVWISHSNGIARWDGAAWQLFAAPDGSGSLERIAVGPDGHVWLGTLAHGLFVFQDGSWSSFSAAAGYLPSDKVDDVAVDAQGRLWAATSNGLVVYDGDSWQWYQMHTADLVDNALRHVAVTAGGPPLPARTVTAPGTLRGTLLDSDAATPLANRPVEICGAPISTVFLDDAPCDGQPVIFATSTDDNGLFALGDLPAGRYAVTFEARRGVWGFYAGRFGFAQRVLLPAGGEINLGTIVYEPDS